MSGEQQQNIKDVATDVTKRERSTIEFPYGDLDDAIEVVTGVHTVGGQSCTLDQLAAYLKQTASSGAFRLRMSFPRIFGLAETERGTIRLTELGLKIVDPSQEQRARVDAFLNVPLYKAIYEKYKGYTLPPPAALEREMASLGVSTKQTDKARQVFDRSARQAGFFALGPDRLVVPPLNRPETRPLDDSQGGAEQKPPGGGGGGGPTLDPVIQALVAKIPSPDKQWPIEEQAQWLQMMAMAFSMIYKPKGNITVKASPASTNGGEQPS